MAKRKNNKSSNKTPLDIIAFSILFAIMVIPLTVYFIYRVQKSDSIFVSADILALIAGLIFEYRRVTKNWKTVLYTLLASYLLSFLAFAPGKGEHHYQLDWHLQNWPYTFCFFFVLIAVIFNEKETTPTFTEGITLLQSVAVIYWFIDRRLYEAPNTMMIILMLIGALFVITSLFHAFTYTPHSNGSRLTLSIWSSIVMCVFAADNIYSLYTGRNIESAESTTQALIIGAQYFLLGVSTIYIAQSILMLIGYIPGKQRFFNAQYFREASELNQRHISRYSAFQVNTFHSLLCLLFVGVVFTANYYLRIVPANFAIWSVFVIFPLLIWFFGKPSR